jgi:hypothetical protein
VRARKFSAVLGTVSLNNSKKTVPTGTSSIVMSKNTIGLFSISGFVGAKVDFRLGCLLGFLLAGFERILGGVLGTGSFF